MGVVFLYCLYFWGLCHPALWKGNGFQNQIFNKPATVFIGIFFAFTLIQLIPLPEEVQRFFSLHQYEIFDTARGLIGLPSSWRPLSHDPRASLAWWLFLLSLVLAINPNGPAISAHGAMAAFRTCVSGSTIRYSAGAGSQYGRFVG